MAQPPTCCWGSGLGTVGNVGHGSSSRWPGFPNFDNYNPPKLTWLAGKSTMNEHVFWKMRDVPMLVFRAVYSGNLRWFLSIKNMFCPLGIPTLCASTHVVWFLHHHWFIYLIWLWPCFQQSFGVTQCDDFYCKCCWQNPVFRCVCSVNSMSRWRFMNMPTWIVPMPTWIFEVVVPNFIRPILVKRDRPFLPGNLEGPLPLPEIRSSFSGVLTTIVI